MSAAPSTREREHREHERVRQREHDDGDAVDVATAPNMMRPTWRARRPVGHHDARRRARRRRARRAAGRAPMVRPGIRRARTPAAARTRRPRTTANRSSVIAPEHQRVVAHIGKAGEQHGEADRLARDRRAHDRDHADQHAGREVERAAQRIDQDRAHGIEQAAAAPGLRSPRPGVAEARPRWRAPAAAAARPPAAASVSRGLLEGARGADHEHDGEQRTRGSASRRRCRSRASRRERRTPAGRCARSCAGRSGRRCGRRPAPARAAGMNWNRPTNPRSSGLLVSLVHLPARPPPPASAGRRWLRYARTQ